jgi:hypothetical protein
MSKNVFLVSDTHFGHKAMYERPFLRADGTPLRPWRSADEADEEMIRRWNAVVKPTDKVYHLGDVAMPRVGLDVLYRLNGDKVLIAGNHDWPWEKHLGKHFRSVRAYWKLDNFTLSHVPIHPDSLRNFDGNIHGHLHWGRVMDLGQIDPRYFCVCVEHTNYTPIAWEEIKQRFSAQVAQSGWIAV